MPKILEHIEQSNADNITFNGNYISIYNTDSTNTMSFNLVSKKTGSSMFSSAITVGAEETWSNFVDRFTEVEITNGDSVAIRVDLGE